MGKSETALKRDEMLRKKYEALFPDAETKARAFDAVAENFYIANFGTMGKADFETLMFSLFLDRVRAVRSPEVQVDSDYELGRTLGLLESRVNTLKLRKDIKYPEEYDWAREFADLLARKSFVFDGKLVRMMIPDPVMFREIRARLEARGAVLDIQLNPKLLQTSPEVFIDLVVELYDIDRAEVAKNVKKELARQDYAKDSAEEESLGQMLKSVFMEAAKGMAASAAASWGTALLGAAGIPAALVPAVGALAGCFITAAAGKIR